MIIMAKVAHSNDSIAEKFSEEGFDTETLQWACIGENIETGVRDLAVRLDIDEERLVKYFIELGEREIEEKKPLLESHWLDFLVIAGIVLIAVLIFWNLTSGAIEWVPQIASTGQQGLVPVSDLPKYHLIGEADLTTDNIPWQLLGSRLIERKDELVGYFTLEEIPSGSFITSSQISKNQGMTSDSSLISLPVPENTLEMVRPGQSITLLLSPRSSENAPLEPFFLQNAIVLGEEQDGTSAWLVVEVQAQDLQEVAPLLSQSDIYVVVP
jgi:hypothetical protein